MQTTPRRFTGPLELVVLDWAGTAVDHGSLAPVGVFLEVFRREGVEVTVAEGREPMGVHKREHIRRMSVMPRIAQAWRDAHDGADCTPDDVDRMYAAATPIQMACLPDYATPITGVIDLIERLRARGIKVGSTTGYNRQMLDVLEPASAAQGYAPDAAMAASEASAGRPYPYLCWTMADRLGASHAAACVKVGDTIVDVEAGLAAGFWTVGVATTGNLVGLDEAAWDALSDDEKEALAIPARKVLADAGPHYVIDRVTDLDAVLDDIERRLAAGERP